MSDVNGGEVIKTSVIGATHVRHGGIVERIAATWGIDGDGRLAKPSDGGFGVITESGRRVSMMDAEAYYKDSLPASVTVGLNESERQAVLLAMAHLSVERPGWDQMLGLIAGKLKGGEMFERFKRLRED